MPRLWLSSFDGNDPSTLEAGEWDRAALGVVVQDRKLAEQCLRLVELIGDGKYREGAHVLETAFDWNTVPPGWAYWSMVHRKLLAANGPDRVTVITPNGPMPSESVPMAEFLARIKEAAKHVRGGSRD